VHHNYNADALDGRNDILVPEHDEVLDDRLPGLRGERRVVLEEESREVARELLGLGRVALGDLEYASTGGIEDVRAAPVFRNNRTRIQLSRRTDLGNEANNLPEALALLVRVHLKEPPHGLIAADHPRRSATEHAPTAKARRRKVSALVPLLEKLLLVPDGVTLDQVL
jgi:hypothetical protein